MSVVTELKADLAQFTEQRLLYVRDGFETRELAGTLVARYGSGMARALRAMGESDALIWREGGDFQSFVDQQVERIDPEWRATDKKRWSARPAGLSFASATQEV